MINQESLNQLLSFKDFAKKTGKNLSYIYRLVRHGRLPFFVVGNKKLIHHTTKIRTRKYKSHRGK